MSNEKIKVRVKYTKQQFLSNKPMEFREFCQSECDVIEMFGEPHAMWMKDVYKINDYPEDPWILVG